MTIKYKNNIGAKRFRGGKDSPKREVVGKINAS
jgi:hypothetical protein